MTSAVDTNILLDVLIPNSAFVTRSQAVLERGSQAGVLVVCEIVYAELGAHFEKADALDDFLAQTRIRLDRSEARCLAIAGQRWRDYRRSTGSLQCPQCGKPISAFCQSCQTPVGSRQHLVADFVVGAHALRHADRLLSRDQGFYRRYFPELRVRDNVADW